MLLPIDPSTVLKGAPSGLVSSKTKLPSYRVSDFIKLASSLMLIPLPTPILIGIIGFGAGMTSAAAVVRWNSEGN